MHNLHVLFLLYSFFGFTIWSNKKILKITPPLRLWVGVGSEGKNMLHDAAIYLGKFALRAVFHQN